MLVNTFFALATFAAHSVLAAPAVASASSVPPKHTASVLPSVVSSRPIVPKTSSIRSATVVRSSILPSHVASASANIPLTSSIIKGGPTPTPSSSGPKPWELKEFAGLESHGQPGQSNTSGLSFIISDPNVLDAGPGPIQQGGSVVFSSTTANCSVEWPWNEQPPWGKNIYCDSSIADQSTWRFQLRKGASGKLDDFSIDIYLIDTVNFRHTAYTQTFVGGVQFSTKTNLIEQCSLPGCLIFLNQSMGKPYPVNYQQLSQCN